MVAISWVWHSCHIWKTQSHGRCFGPLALTIFLSLLPQWSLKELGCECLYWAWTPHSQLFLVWAVWFSVIPSVKLQKKLLWSESWGWVTPFKLDLGTGWMTHTKAWGWMRCRWTEVGQAARLGWHTGYATDAKLGGWRLTRLVWLTNTVLLMAWNYIKIYNVWDYSDCHAGSVCCHHYYLVLSLKIHWNSLTSTKEFKSPKDGPCTNCIWCFLEIYLLTFYTTIHTSKFTSFLFAFFLGSLSRIIVLLSRHLSMSLNKHAHWVVDSFPRPYPSTAQGWLFNPKHLTQNLLVWDSYNQFSVQHW